jgi:prepilin-type N-terminal cleavage/methylation domain-containing protein
MRAAGIASRGFSIIEMLVVAAISALVLTAVAASFIGGVRVWERAKEFEAAFTESLLALEAFERDYRNSFPFYGIPFVCESDSISFPGMVGTDEIRQIGTIKYFADHGEEVSLCRKTWVYPHPEPKECERLVSRIESLKLSGCYPSDLGKEDGIPLEKPLEETDDAPVGVRVELIIEDVGQPDTITRTVFLRRK